MRWRTPWYPGVALAYALNVPYAVGAFFTGLLAALGMIFVERQTRLPRDAIMGIVFTAFFAAGLLLVSLNPTSVNVNTILFGNILAISDADARQVVMISAVSLVILCLKWRDLMVVFFDADHARAIAIPATTLRIVFFSLLAACTVAALQTVGACLVIAMVITPGATAYLLTDRFHRLLILSVCIGTLCGFLGAYLSYFIDGATGGVIVTLQTVVFAVAFYFAPKHGVLASRRRIRHASTSAAANE